MYVFQFRTKFSVCYSVHNLSEFYWKYIFTNVVYVIFSIITVDVLPVEFLLALYKFLTICRQTIHKCSFQKHFTFYSTRTKHLHMYINLNVFKKPFVQVVEHAIQNNDVVIISDSRTHTQSPNALPPKKRGGGAKTSSPQEGSINNMHNI